MLLGVASAVPNQSPHLPFPLPDPDAGRIEEARRRAAQENLRALHQKMEAFVRAWNEFAAEYVERGTFNIKKAKRVREAWRELEREDAWPR